jgi:hypothetical protein
MAHQDDVDALPGPELVDEAYALSLRAAVSEVGDEDEQLHGDRESGRPAAGASCTSAGLGVPTI